jgi:hypothetical protein
MGCGDKLRSLAASVAVLGPRHSAMVVGIRCDGVAARASACSIRYTVATALVVGMPPPA